jgi:hypothetical protein
MDTFHKLKESNSKFQTRYKVMKTYKEACQVNKTTYREEVFGDLINKYNKKSYSVGKLTNPKSLFPMSALLIEDSKLTDHFKYKIQTEKLLKDLGVVLNIQNGVLEHSDPSVQKKILDRRISLNIEKTFRPLLKKNINDLMNEISINKQENDKCRKTIQYMKTEGNINDPINLISHTVHIEPKKYHIDLSDIKTTDLGANTTCTNYRVTWGGESHEVLPRTDRRLISTIKPIANLKIYKSNLKKAVLQESDIINSNTSSNQSLFNLKTPTLPVMLNNTDTFSKPKDAMESLYSKVSKKDFKTKKATKDAIHSYFCKYTNIPIEDDK